MVMHTSGIAMQYSVEDLRCQEKRRTYEKRGVVPFVLEMKDCTKCGLFDFIHFVYSGNFKGNGLVAKAS
jgi:hypothetical protein